MTDIVERLLAKHFFSDNVMAARTPQDEATIETYRAERKEAADEIERLRNDAQASRIEENGAMQKPAKSPCYLVTVRKQSHDPNQRRPDHA